LALAQVAAADLDIAVVSQLPATQLPLGDQLKPGPLQVIRLKAFIGRHGAIDEAQCDPDGLYARAAKERLSLLPD
jgi:hypothetical protein